MIEFKNEPFLVKEQMISLPRDVRQNIFPSFPLGLHLSSPDTCTLNGKDVRTTQNFKPGMYALVIKHRGYEDIAKTIDIEPDSKPYSIQQIIYPKDLQVDIKVSYDVAPENPSIQYTCTLENETTKQVYKIKTGDKVPAGCYTCKIELPSYESEIQRELIMPSDNPYLISRRLISISRRVIAEITAEYPLGIIIPDEIVINGQVVGENFKIKPGIYDFTILKQGYVPIRKRLSILASSDDFVLKEKLETKTSKVTFSFLDSSVYCKLIHKVLRFLRYLLNRN